jgi:hypothetical protein
MALYARAAQGLGYLAEATGAIDLAEEGLEKIDSLTGKRASKFLRKEAAKVMGLKKGDAFKTLPRTVLPIVRNEQLDPSLRLTISAVNHETQGLAAVNTSIGLLADQVAENTTALEYTPHNNFNYSVGGVYQNFADVSAIAENLAQHDSAMFYDTQDVYHHGGDIADLSAVIAGVKDNAKDIDDLEAAAAYFTNDVYQQGYGGTLKGVADQSAIVDAIKATTTRVDNLGDFGVVYASTAGATYSGSTSYVWGAWAQDSRTMTVAEADGNVISFPTAGFMDVTKTPIRGMVHFTEYFEPATAEVLTIALEGSSDSTTWGVVKGSEIQVTGPDHVYYRASYVAGSTSRYWRVHITASSTTGFTVGIAGLSTGAFTYVQTGS